MRRGADPESRRDGIGHGTPSVLSQAGRVGTLRSVELPLDKRDVQAIMIGLFDANSKLDRILRYLLDEDDGEEEDPDPR
jgi:hypothetical protein